MEAVLILLGGILFACLLIIYTSFSWGFVGYKLWYWFLLPVFPTMPHLTFYQAVGIVIFMILFKNHSLVTVKDEYRDKKQEYWNMVLGPWLTLGVSYLVYLIIK